MYCSLYPWTSEIAYFLQLTTGKENETYILHFMAWIEES